MARLLATGPGITLHRWMPPKVLRPTGKPVLARKLDVTVATLTEAGGGALGELIVALKEYESVLGERGEGHPGLIGLLAAVRSRARESAVDSLPVEARVLVSDLPAQVDRETRRLRLGATPDGNAKGPELLKARPVIDHLPSTGMGKFDAELHPAEGVLRVTLRVHFAFQDETADDAFGREAAKWAGADERGTWQAEFTKVVEGIWSGKHRFRCADPEWALPPIALEVRVKAVDSPKDAHHQVRVRRQGADEQLYRGENRPESMWDPTAERVVNLDEHDVKRVPHATGAKAVRDVITKDLQPRVGQLPDGDGNTEVRVPFDDARDQPVSTAGLEGLVRLLRPWPAERVAIQLIGLHGADGKGLSRDGALARCATVRDWLATRTPHAVSSLEAMPFQRPHFLANRPPIVAGPEGSVRVLVGPQASFAPTAPYSTAAHEMGHALGNVDFYRDDQSRAKKSLEAKEANPVQIGLGKAQSRFYQLVDAARMTDQSPTVGVVTDSIMSMGEHVLPIHYLPFWEALGETTKGTIRAEDWIIES